MNAAAILLLAATVLAAGPVAPPPVPPPPMAFGEDGEFAVNYFEEDIAYPCENGGMEVHQKVEIRGPVGAARNLWIAVVHDSTSMVAISDTVLALGAEERRGPWMKVSSPVRGVLWTSVDLNWVLERGRWVVIVGDGEELARVKFVPPEGVE